MFQVTLETNDYEEKEFVEYLAKRDITFEPTGNVYAIAGGGEDVVYTADSEETLLTMIDDFWGGRDQFDFTIEEV
jgi:hypothetical protein